MILISVLLMAGAEGPAPAAAPAAATPAPAPPARKAKAPEATCWVERPTGSHIRVPICATREELEKAQRDGQDAVTGEMRGSASGFKKKP